MLDLNGIKESLRLNEEYLSRIIESEEVNERLGDYFLQLYEETNEFRHFALSEQVRNCSHKLFFDLHEFHKLADLTGANLCKSKFCPMCQKFFQRSRLERFVPPMLETSNEYDLYHITFTVPNVKSVALKTTIDILFESFRKLIEFFSCKRPISGYDFSQYGYVAAIRSLEITYKNKDNTYHPHLHSIFALERGLFFEKNVVNKFSWSKDDNGKRTLEHKFSSFEIFLQKLWRLIVDQFTSTTYKFADRLSRDGVTDEVKKAFGEEKVKKTRARGKDRISLKNVESLGVNDGYSVVMIPIINDSFFEVFKYVSKLNSDDKDQHVAFMTYKQFKTIYFALHGRKTIQGYGRWFRMKTEDEIDETVDDFYRLFKSYLYQSDAPFGIVYNPHEVRALQKEGKYAFISGKQIYRALSPNDVSSLMANDNGEPLPQRKVLLDSFTYAFDKYLEEKRKKELFENMETYEVEKQTLYKLSYEQLTFFDELFGAHNEENTN